MTHKINKTDEEWREQLTPEQYEVTRHKGTEPPFDNKYWNEKRDGIYHCACCGEALFASETKYDSGTGWPSFYAPLNEDDIEIEEDAGHGMIRSEVHCGKCGAHLGHVFDDGPMPTGLRYCLNSASLELKRRADGEQ